MGAQAGSRGTGTRTQEGLAPQRFSRPPPSSARPSPQPESSAEHRSGPKEVSMVFQLGGKKIQVDTYKTSWPLNIFYKRQGVQIQVNPDSHWWCLWLCSSTDDIQAIDCTIVLRSSLGQDNSAKDSCTNC